ncbi:MAG: hypothetical protein L0312_06855, partial [Acidobacteria bacterium]|nr:hypothetical protein [Acidobacteriota bacterium]
MFVHNRANSKTSDLATPVCQMLGATRNGSTTSSALTRFPAFHSKAAALLERQKKRGKRGNNGKRGIWGMFHRKLKVDNSS